MTVEITIHESLTSKQNFRGKKRKQYSLMMPGENTL